MNWMIYGASGYTGRLIADLAIERGERPVLAGRDPAKIAAIAAPRGLPYRIFDLSDPDEIAKQLRDVDAVAHCAGPFSSTSEPMISGCLRSGAHYLDITGEIDVFEAAFARDAEAREAGVVLLPGAGFDVVPTDCLAGMVAAELPAATRLDLAFQASGGISAGTLKSALEGAGMGGRARIDGDICAVPLAWRRREVAFPSGGRTVTSLPWGDVSTAFHSTGIGTITTFTRLPGLDRMPTRAASPARALLGAAPVQRLGKTAIGALVRGPGRAHRSRSWVEVYAEAADESGRSVSAALIGPDTYELTADAVLRAVGVLRSEPPRPGTHTPATAFGADFVRRLHGVKVIEPA